MRRNHSTIHWLNRARVDATVPTAHPGASPQAALTAVVDPHGAHVVAATVVVPATVVPATVVVAAPPAVVVAATVVVVAGAAVVVVVVAAAAVVVAAAAVVVAPAAAVVVAPAAAVVAAAAVVVVQVHDVAAHPARRQRKTNARIDTMVWHAKDGAGGCDAQA